jgi:polyhydroxyalkanoate synthesis regulator protein
MQTQQQPILIKRYAGSRLYDPAAARYVTLEQLRRWQAQGVSFTVIDAGTGADIRRVLLA